MPTTHGGSFSNTSLRAQSPDLPAKGNLPIGAEADEVKNLLADVDADYRQ